MPNILQSRQNMISCQLKTWGVLNQAILGLMLHAPREKFVPEAYQQLAYADTDIPLLKNQKMLPPKTLARAIQALDIQHADHILEIGTGSGYSTLLLARLGKKLTSIEIVPELHHLAKQNLDTFSPHNITLILGDGALGDSTAPDNLFDKILVTGCYPEAIPNELLNQLKPGGKLFAFIGHAPSQEAVLISKSLDNVVSQESLFETVVTPLIHAPIHHRFNF